MWTTGPLINITNVKQYTPYKAQQPPPGYDKKHGHSQRLPSNDKIEGYAVINTTYRFKCCSCLEKFSFRESLLFSRNADEYRTFSKYMNTHDLSIDVKEPMIIIEKNRHCPNRKKHGPAEYEQIYDDNPRRGIHLETETRFPKDKWAWMESLSTFKDGFYIIKRGDIGIGVLTDSDLKEYEKMTGVRLNMIDVSDSQKKLEGEWKPVAGDPTRKKYVLKHNVHLFGWRLHMTERGMRERWRALHSKNGKDYSSIANLELGGWVPNGGREQSIIWEGRVQHGGWAAIGGRYPSFCFNDLRP